MEKFDDPQVELNYISLDNAILVDRLNDFGRVPDSITDLYERGIKFIENQSFEKSTQAFQEALNNSPQFLSKFFQNLIAVSQHNLGVQVFSQGRFDDSLKLYNEVLASISDDFSLSATVEHNIAHATAENSNEEGERRASEKKYFEAIAKFQEAFKVCPKKVKSRGRYKRSIAKCAVELWLSNEMCSEKALNKLEEAFIFTPAEADRKEILNLQVFILNAEANKLQYEGKFDEAAEKYCKAWDMTNDTWSQKYFKQLKKNAICRKGRTVSTSEYVDELIEQNEEMKKKFLVGKMDLKNLLSFTQKTFFNFAAVFGEVGKLIASLFDLFITILDNLLSKKRFEESLEVIAIAQTLFPRERENLKNLADEIKSSLNLEDQEQNISTNLRNIEAGNAAAKSVEQTKPDRKVKVDLKQSGIFWLSSLLVATFLAIIMKFYF